jgi:glutamine amidotransferase
MSRLGFESIITDDADEIRKAARVIFPGVGEAGSAMKYLKDRELDKLIISLTQPVLGICLGLQLLCRHSEEGNTKCLNVFDSDVRMFPKTDKVPHMGWNNFSSLQGDIFKGVTVKDDVYYVHSYYSTLSACTSAICDYILPFSSAMIRDNFYAVQFHPEKSALVGERILSNFLEQ